MAFVLEKYQSEDIEDVVSKAAASFGIGFSPEELSNLPTFGSLCDLAVSKMGSRQAADCTKQQAFYKLRTAFVGAGLTGAKSVLPSTPLEVLLPPKKRRRKAQEVTFQLDMRISLLRPPRWLSISLTILGLASFICLFWNWRIGLLGLGITIAGGLLAVKWGNCFREKTAGELAGRLVRENYAQMRRFKSTCNPVEVEQVFRELFVEGLGTIDATVLTREALFK